MFPPSGAQAFIARPGDYNGDGLDDIAVLVTHLEGGAQINEGVYLLFGRQGGWTGELDLLTDSGAVIGGLVGTASLDNAGDVNGDGIDDLVIGDAGTDAVSMFFGRTNWTASNLLNADFTNAGAPALDGFVVDNAVPAGAIDQVAGLWHLSSRRGGEAGHSGPHSLWYGDETLGNFAVGHSAGRVTSSTVNLTAVSGAELSFNTILNVEGGTLSDRARVLISKNGGAFEEVLAKPTTLTNPTTGWTTATLNLSSFAGSQIQIRFDFDTVDAIGNTTEGWLIDDVVVRQFFTAANPDVKLTAGAAATLDVSGIGDFSGDGVADFGVLQKSATNQVNISLIEGSASGAPAVNGALSAAADTVFAFNTDDSGSRGLQLSGGGDVDHDGADELLITSTTASRVVFGGDVAAANPVNLDAFVTADPGRVLQLARRLAHRARRCQRRRLRRSGRHRSGQDPAPGGDLPERADGLQLPPGRPGVHGCRARRVRSRRAGPGVRVRQARLHRVDPVERLRRQPHR